MGPTHILQNEGISEKRTTIPKTTPMYAGSGFRDCRVEGLRVLTLRFCRSVELRFLVQGSGFTIASFFFLLSQPKFPPG